MATSVPGRIDTQRAPDMSSKSRRSDERPITFIPLASARECVLNFVRTGPRRSNLRRSLRDAAKAQHKFTMVRDFRPGRHLFLHLEVRTAYDVGKQDLGGRMGIGRSRAGVASNQVHEPAQLGLRMVETSGTGPAIRPCEDRLVAVRTMDPLQFFGHEVQGRILGHFHKGIFAPAIAIAVGQPRFADRWLCTLTPGSKAPPSQPSPRQSRTGWYLRRWVSVERHCHGSLSRNIPNAPKCSASQFASKNFQTGVSKGFQNPFAPRIRCSRWRFIASCVVSYNRHSTSASRRLADNSRFGLLKRRIVIKCPR